MCDTLPTPTNLHRWRSGGGGVEAVRGKGNDGARTGWVQDCSQPEEISMAPRQVLRLLADILEKERLKKCQIHVRPTRFIIPTELTVQWVR